MAEPSRVEEAADAAADSSDPPQPAAAATEEADTAEPLEQLLRKDVKEAEEAKVRGNALYASKDYAGAVAAYSEGVELCPSVDSGEEGADGSSTPSPSPSPSSSSSSPPSSSPSPSVLLLSVLYNNRAAAHLQLQAYAEVIADCTASLALQSSSKALLRRSVAYERTGKLSEAIADLTAAIAQGAGSREEETRLRRLEGEKKAADEKMKDEMLGKLKELGNGLLGKFGMSLDNFKAVKDPSSGSYSISFNK